MVLSYPRQMPAANIAALTFDLQRVDYGSPEAGGGGGAVTAGLPRWSGRWTLAETTPGESAQWEAFVSSLRGMQRTFIGRDHRRPRPIYFAGGLPAGWSGQLASWSQSLTADGQAILSVTGLYGGMGVGASDPVDFRWTGTDGLARRFLVRALQDVPSSSGAASFPIEPAIPSFVPSIAVAHMDDCGCTMRLTDETKIAETTLYGSIAGSVIAGLQDLRP